ncbi:DUF6973 domain-containing protein [Photobacterium halotolerans]|uniref:DUF6973 domain-containing protein n=1 Tax=Photobacterium halotolerans TaxID=265726 RepID=A0A0F5VFX8_9GAMM|nr:hypothetical protein [Photobacterium halotolerans]KKD00973.1 hypothetical protein KY46_04090 [Photobacterium halotolerans]
MSALKQYDRLTDAEKDYVKSNPFHVFSIKSAKEKAFEETSREFGKNGRNDASDAFRHCFWSALMARELGYMNAQRFTNAHESSPDNPFMEKKMDLHNNDVGLCIGARGGSDRSLSNACMAALQGGELMIIP